MTLNPSGMGFKDLLRRPGLVMMLAAVLLLLGGCATSGGRLQNSAEVTELFEKKQILDGYQYFFSGFAEIPYGIVGISTDYHLYTRMWEPFTPDPELLGQLIYRMQNVYDTPPRGAWILDPEGKRVGFWYSSRHATVVRMKAKRQIVVGTPEPPELRGIP